MQIPSFKALQLFTYLSIAAVIAAPVYSRQDAAAKPTEHILGTITAVDSSAHTVTVKGDKESGDFVVSTLNTRTLLKVVPGAKDLKNATRIGADDLAVGDRVDVRGFKDGAGANAIAAKSVVLMSARELQEKHQADAAAWQNSISGLAASVDPAGSIVLSTKTAEGPKQVTVQIPASAEFTRYSPENPKTPARSQLADIQPGDQVRVIGQKSADGSSISAEKVYSGAFRTVAGTITSISPETKEITLKNLQTKQPVRVVLASDSAVRKLPPEMAAMIARRLNPNSAAAPRPQQPADSQVRPSAPEGGTSPEAGHAGPGMRGPRNGDLAQVVQHLPEIAVSDLKPGDAVIVSGALGADKLQVIATNIIAGVEPIFQSAPPRQGQSLDGWSLDMSAPAQQ